MPHVSRWRPLAWTVALAVGLALADSHAASEQNLLRNPSFEQTLQDHPWMPAAWDTFQSGLNTVFFGRDTLLAHGGSYAVNVANISTLVPMWYNWSQAVEVGPAAWNKDAVFSVWTRSNGQQGRAYLLCQASRDTIQQNAFRWNMSRDSAAFRMHVAKLDDPAHNLGWDRLYFTDSETDWVQREVRVFVPPSTNTIMVRCGLFGTGQVLFDDASLTIVPARPQKPVPLNTNLLEDPGFEGDGNAWEYSMPPYPKMRLERDTTVKHRGRAAIRYEGGTAGPVRARTGVGQVVSLHDISSKRVRLSAWVRTDSLKDLAYLRMYFTTIEGIVRAGPYQRFGGDTPWTKTVLEADAPPGTLMTWAWLYLVGPAHGTVFYDDVSLEVLGPAQYIKAGTPPPKVMPRELPP